MNNQAKRIVSMLLMLLMLFSLAVPAAFAEETALDSALAADAADTGESSNDCSSILDPYVPLTPADESPYTSYSAIGDSIAAGYGPLLADNTWNHFYYDKPPVGAYPYEITKDLGLDLQEDFNSMLCVDQRVIDVYYAMGGDPGPVVDPDNTTSTLDYLEDARLYHSAAYMKVLENLHESGEGAQRIVDSDLITIQIGFGDLFIYPLHRTNYDYLKVATMIRYGYQSYVEYFTKMLSLINDLNPDAKVLVMSLYNPFEKYEFESYQDENYYRLLTSSLSLLNVQLKAWCVLYGCTYVDITGLGDYIDYKTTTVPSGEFLSYIVGHENHPGAAGHRYVEGKILSALNLAKPSETPTTDDETVYLAFSSDIHNGDNGIPAQRLDSFLNTVSDQLGDITFDYACLCGDLGADNAGSAYPNKVQIVMDTINNNANVKGGIYTTGNHEYNPGTYDKNSQYEPYSKYTRLGEAANTDEYQIYCFGAAHWDYKFDDADIDALAAYMEQADSTKPVFIMSHFPLHVIPNRTMGNSAKVIEVLNNYPNAIFVWGHNHTESDPHYGIVYSGDLDGTKINFTYCSAGCMSDSEYSSGSANTTAKGLVAAIDGDEDLTLTFYDKEFKVLCSYNVNYITGTADELDVDIGDVEPNFDNQVYYSQSTLDDGEYVIAVGKIAMNNTYTNGYWNIDEYGEDYHYTGMKGADVSVKSGKIIGGLTADQVWTVNKVSNGVTIQDNTGKYLTGYYTSKVGGDIVLETEQKGDYSVWTYSDSNLKNVGTGKQLNFEVESDIHGTKTDGEADLFDLRSAASDTISVYSTKAPASSTTTNYSAVSSLEDGKWYIITAEGRALTSENHDGYVNRNSETAVYKYTGLKGKSVTVTDGVITSQVTTDMLWQAEKVSGGFALKNIDGKYLEETYSTSDSYYTGVGALFVSDAAEAWVFSGTALTGNDNGKGLNYQSQSDIDGTKESGNMDFFTCRSSSRDTVTIYLSLYGTQTPVDPNEVLDSDNEIAPQEIETYYYALINSLKYLKDGAQIILTSGNRYFSDQHDDGFMDLNGGTNYYHYSGVHAGELNVTTSSSVISLDGNTNATVWTVREADGGYYFVNSEGRYLSADYNSDTNTLGYYDDQHQFKGEGSIYLTEEPSDKSIWIIAMDANGMCSLRTKALAKYVKYQSSHTSGNVRLWPEAEKQLSFFTFRSGESKEFCIYQATTVKHNLVTSGELKNGATVVFAYDGYFMGSNKGIGFRHLSSNGKYYEYSGLSAGNLGATAGTSLTTLPAVTQAMTWTVEKVDGGYRFKNANGRYLGLYYAENIPFDYDYNGEYITATSSGTNRLTLYAEPNDSCVWTVSISNGVATVRNGQYTSRYLTYNDKAKTSGTIYDPADPNTISVFTVRGSSSYPLYIYQETKTGIAIIENNGQYILADKGFALSSNVGNGYMVSGNSYWYDGLDAVSIQEDNNKITSTVTNDMVWTFIKEGDGYYIKSSDGLYLNAKYVKPYTTRGNIILSLSETPEKWTYSNGYFIGANGKRIAYQTNEGTTSVFTLRSGEGDSSRFTLYKLTDLGTRTALYTAGIGGTVSLDKEEFTKNDEPITWNGSTATADPGYTFEGWYKGNQLLTATPEFIPAGTGAYEARFKESTATHTYQVMISGEGDPTVPKLTSNKQTLGVSTGVALGSTAQKTAGYTFLYWTSDAEGKNIVTRNTTCKPNKVDGLYQDGTYYAWYAKEIVCYEYTPAPISGVESGTHHLYINGVDCGEFVFTNTDDGWTIYSTANKKFVVINADRELAYSSVSCAWDYSSAFGFSVAVTTKILRIFPVISRHYITEKNGALTESLVIETDTELVDLVPTGYTEHVIDANAKNITDEYHSGVCSRCGQAVNKENHKFTTFTDNGDGTHKAVCGDCGYETSVAHDFNRVSVDNETHQCTCTLCSCVVSEAHTIIYIDAGAKHSYGCACGFKSELLVHEYTYTPNGDGTHTGVCVCGSKVQDACSFVEGVCTVCGGRNPADAKITGVNVNITSERSYANFIARIFGRYTTVYNVEIVPVADMVEVKSVSYASSEDGQYITGTNFTSDTAVTELWIKVVDSNNAVTVWHYSYGTVTTV